MGKKKIKKEIHKLLDEINDEDTLNILKEEIAGYATTAKKDILDDLTPEQLKELDKAIEEVDKGEVIPWEDLKKEMAKWRSK